MANCQLWCDPRNGSDAAFQKSLTELGAMSTHPELASVPWAIWGHSGGGHWAGGMTLLHPDRVAAAWLRSGVPALKEVEGKLRPYTIPDAACQVPVMCNLGAKEGITDKEGRFAAVWPQVEIFFESVRAKRGLIGVSVDPLSIHDCGNQRYLAISWFDACLTTRLPAKNDDPLKSLSNHNGWIATFNADDASFVAPVPASKFTGATERSVWLPSESVATAWTQYMKDTAVTDTTPPPAPTDVRVAGNVLTWSAEADLESGLAGFIIECDGEFLANLPEQGKNPFGRPIFQNLSYSDTPTQPLVEMRFTDATAESGKPHCYRIIAVNTVGLKSR
jgi:pimeloyl-ACP methyl ester carboxylesterase